jgi:hypothetical protein
MLFPVLVAGWSYRGIEVFDFAWAFIESYEKDTGVFGMYESMM